MNKSEVLRHILHQAEGNPFANYWQRLASTARTSWQLGTGPMGGKANPLGALGIFLSQHPEIASTLLGFLLPAMMAGKNRWGKAAGGAALAGGLGLAGKWAWDNRGRAASALGGFFGKTADEAMKVSLDPRIERAEQALAQANAQLATLQKESGRWRSQSAKWQGQSDAWRAEMAAVRAQANEAVRTITSLEAGIRSGELARENVNAAADTARERIPLAKVFVKERPVTDKVSKAGPPGSIPVRAGLWAFGNSTLKQMNRDPHFIEALKKVNEESKYPYAPTVSMQGK